MPITHKLRGPASNTVYTDALPVSSAEKYNFILVAALNKLASCHIKTNPAHMTTSMKQSAEGGRPNADSGRQIWKSIARSTAKLCTIAKSNHYLSCIEKASGDPKDLNQILKNIIMRDEVTKLPLYYSENQG